MATSRASQAGVAEPSEPQRFSVPAGADSKLTHYLFRYPAKFHAPVVRGLLQRYANPNDRILDPFCGSGTALVEAAVLGREATGTDVDPVAIEVAQAKIDIHDLPHLEYLVSVMSKRVVELERDSAEYRARMFKDIADRTFASCIRREALWVPAIPRLDHWFRKYVTIDLARILNEIEKLDASEVERRFFRVAFASVIRNASNADPVPVSGLEVTSHMKKRDAAGRLINPPQLYLAALKKSFAAVVELNEQRNLSARQMASIGDASSLDFADGVFDLVLTSPPYHNAVDYYRRHQLEMYWLGHTSTHDDRLALLPKYIGRPKIPQTHPIFDTQWTGGPIASEWEHKIREVDFRRANDFIAYTASMARVFTELHRVTTQSARILMVVGQSSWRGETIPTDILLAESAVGRFELVETLWYPVKNRYMSYSRRNGADIDREYVLVFKRQD